MIPELLSQLEDTAVGMQIQTANQFSPDQLATIKATVAKGTTDQEFKLFIEVCKYHALNPFARQIYAVVRVSKKDGSRSLCIQTSIDGYRLLAERSGKYAGQTGPQWCGQDGEWKDVWLSDNPPAAARIGIFRKDFQHPIWGVVKYKSYAQPSPLWDKMPDVMLAKCAESLALRKAFPAEMSGIYTREEMDQADGDLPAVDHSYMVESAAPQQEEPPTPTKQPKSPLGACYDRAKILECFTWIPDGGKANVDAFLKWAGEKLGREIATKDLTLEDLEILHKEMDALKVVEQATAEQPRP